VLRYHRLEDAEPHRAAERAPKIYRVPPRGRSGPFPIVEVRIVAKIAREFYTDAAGKNPDGDTWVIRNVSFPFRLAAAGQS
jgi:hypothetical protein